MLVSCNMYRPSQDEQTSDVWTVSLSITDKLKQQVMSVIFFFLLILPSLSPFPSLTAWARLMPTNNDLVAPLQRYWYSRTTHSQSPQWHSMNGTTTSACFSWFATKVRTKPRAWRFFFCLPLNLLALPRVQGTPKDWCKIFRRLLCVWCPLLDLCVFRIRCDTHQAGPY